MPILNFTFSEKGCDYIEEGLKILATILGNSDDISDKMWLYFNELNYILSGKPEELLEYQGDVSGLSEIKQSLLKQNLEGWAQEYITEMIPTFCNFIKKG
mmetsp:Transcript_15121/g.12840  ORF Transcript_15121/g.12840 Transcript_15121/m.12840 type:complete len:100 (+) Transcript_15121:2018-2317(+)